MFGQGNYYILVNIFRQLVTKSEKQNNNQFFVCDKSYIKNHSFKFNCYLKLIHFITFSGIFIGKCEINTIFD